MITRSDTVQESAGRSFTVKPPAPQPPPSTGQLTLTVKSVGGVKTTLSQFSALNTLQVSVGFAVGVGVPNGRVGGGVRVGVAVGVTTGDSSALGAIAREELITAAASATTAAARIADIVARLVTAVCRKTASWQASSS